MDYKNQEDILSKIPDYFWPAFAGELVSVTSASILDRYSDGFYRFNFMEGTNGWNAAFNMTCKKLNIEWLYEYYNKLDWWESDTFDRNIGELLASEFIEADNTGSNPYYSWIIDNLYGNEEDDVNE